MKRPICFISLIVLAINIACLNDFNFFLLFLLILFSFIPIFIFTSDSHKKAHFIFIFVLSIISMIIIKEGLNKPDFINSLENEKISNSDTWTRIRGRVANYSHIDKSKDNPKSKKIITKLTLNNAYISLNRGNDTYLSYIGNISVSGPFTEIGLNDCIEVRGKIEKLELAKDNNTFNERLYYNSIGSLSKCCAYSISIVSKNHNPIFFLSNLIKDSANSTFSAVSKNYKGQLKSIIMGDQGDLSKSDKNTYTLNGIGHLLAISGLHISFLGISLYRFIKKMGLSFIFSSLISGSLIFIYSISVGLPISAVRALSMFIVLLGANVFGRNYDHYSALSLQAILTLLHNPHAIEGPSFILSYLAVLFLIMGNELNTSLKKRLLKGKYNFSIIKLLINPLESFLVSIFIFLGLLPFNLFFFGFVPAYSLLINILVLPLSSFLIILGIFVVILDFLLNPVFGHFFGNFFIGSTETLINLFELLADKISSMDLATRLEGSPGYFEIGFYYLALILGLLIIKKLIKPRII